MIQAVTRDRLSCVQGRRREKVAREFDCRRRRTYSSPTFPMTDDQTPATKGDLHRLESRMEQGFQRLDDAIDRVLTVLINVDKRLTQSVDDHERRIRRLEQTVGVAA